MTTEGSAEAYEKLTLASLKKAAAPDSDATYHNNRAAIFASPAAAAASAEMAEALNRLAGTPAAAGSPPATTPSVTPVPSTDRNGNGRVAGPGAPGKELARRESA